MRKLFNLLCAVVIITITTLQAQSTREVFMAPRDIVRGWFGEPDNRHKRVDNSFLVWAYEGDKEITLILFWPFPTQEVGGDGTWLDRFKPTQVVYRAVLIAYMPPELYWRPSQEDLDPEPVWPKEIWRGDP